MPTEIHRIRASAGAGLVPMRTQAAMKASPITPRNNSIVSTSQCDAATILTKISDAPSTTAAAIPGAEAKTKRKVKGKNTLDV